jgi:hypothetical protein
MSDNHGVTCSPDTRLESFAAELTSAAYRVALRHGTRGTWLGLELELWRVLTEVVKKWGLESPPSPEVAFACDWAGGQPEPTHGDDRDGHGPWHEARLPLPGE